MALLIGVTICTTPVALLVETARDRVETVVETVVFYVETVGTVERVS